MDYCTGTQFYTILTKTLQELQAKTCKTYYHLGIFFFTIHLTVGRGTRGFSRVRWEFLVMAEGQHIFSRRPVHYKDLTETGNRAGIVSGTQGNSPLTLCRLKFPLS